MKVTFLKDHLEHKSGEAAEVSEERAAYFEKVGVAVVKEKQVIIPKKEKAVKK